MSRSFKNWWRRRLRRALGVHEPGSPSIELCGVSRWHEGANFWEPPVQIALRDLCKPGRVVFDVGANFGGLTTLMSRLVGPRGAVCAFEASPRIVGKCQANCILQGCGNVQVYHAAVYHRSHATVPLFLGGHLNDSIYAGSNNQSAAYHVPTLALDDFVASTGLEPDVIKMDIEGAEFDALVGASQIISRLKPHLILEAQPEDSRCLDLLRKQGYVAIDLSNYREVRRASDYPGGSSIRNNLYLHQSRFPETNYRLPFTFVEMAALTRGDFVASGGSWRSTRPLTLPKGRYLIDVDFQAAGKENEVMCGVKASDHVIFRYHAFSALLAQSYRDWVVHLNDSAPVELYFDFQNGTNDPTLLFGDGTRIFRISEFDQVTQWMW